MAVLNGSDRTGIWAELMRQLGQYGSVSINRVELKAAVDALDDFLEANSAAINQAIPQPARGALNGSQKAFIVSAVARRRAERA